MTELTGSLFNLIQSTNRYSNYNIGENGSNKTNKLVAAVGLTLVFFNQSVVNTNLTVNNSAESIAKFAESLLKESNHILYRTSTTSIDSFSIDEEGVLSMNDDIRQKDLDNLEEKTVIKLSHVNTKIDHLNDSIIEIKSTLDSIDNKLNDLPTKTFVEKEISRNTNKFLLWLGGSLIVTGTALAGFITWYLPMILNTQ